MGRHANMANSYVVYIHTFLPSIYMYFYMCISAHVHRYVSHM